MRQTSSTKEPKQSLISPPVLSAAMYFSYFMAFGSFFPFINLYYERLGLSGIQIGTLTAVPVFVSSSTVLIWGSIADRFQWHRGILRASFVLGAGAILLLSTAETYQELMIYVIVFAFFSSSSVPLLDSSALEAAANSGRTYGELRLWGSVSQIGMMVDTISKKNTIRPPYLSVHMPTGRRNSEPVSTGNATSIPNCVSLRSRVFLIGIPITANIIQTMKHTVNAKVLALTTDQAL
jgi:MFS family permease